MPDNQNRVHRRVIYVTDDNSIYDQGGTYVFIGIQQFVRDIVNGNCCFLCGTSDTLVSFNNEHVMPDWVIRRFGLERASITLPNGAHVKYPECKVPCCQSCNTWLGENVERPMSTLLGMSPRDVVSAMR